MNVEYCEIYDFLSGGSKKFIIPVYQRDYSWRTIPHCDKLWFDLNKLVDSSEEKEHFIGTLVVVAHAKGEKIIVDGQQRLTTVTLFLLAMHKFLQKKLNKTTDEENLENDILENYLVLRYSSEQRRIRLKPNKQDQINFDKLFADMEISQTDSNIINNYKFFYKKISQSNFSCRQLFNAFEKLSIVVIELDSKENAQVIFESLNSTGLDLNSYDLARNYILMDLKPEKQETIYNLYWQEIEKNTGSDVAEFLRNFLIYFNQKKVKKENIYEEFKKYASHHNNDKEEISKEMHRFSLFYSQILQINKFGNDKIDNALKNLIQKNGADFKVCICFLFDVFNNHKNGKIQNHELLQIINLLESYAIRKFIVSNSKQGLNSWFPTLSKKIAEQTNKGYSYFDAFNFLIASSTKHSYKFYDDQEFLEALKYREIYGNHSAKHLLSILENHNNVIVLTEDLEIDHIMPQKLTPKWKSDLGDNWQEIHKKYLDTLGNLSLTLKENNVKMGNKSFDEKQKIDYESSKLKLTKSLASGEKWGEEQILARAEKLAKEALQIWKYPAKSTITINTDDEEDDVFDLSSEDYPKGKKLVAIFLEDKEVKITHWKDFTATICGFFYNLSPTEFNFVIQDGELSKYFSNQQNELRVAKEYHSHKYVEANHSAEFTIKFCQKICDKMNYDPENIRYKLR
jgi:uncharacterized protein with ParB-like and HNH nuclease domain